MRILVVFQHYYPEPFRITDLCEELVKQGHEVTVVTGTPNYPEGKVYKGYKGKAKRDEVLNCVKIHRCFEIARRKGILFRFLNYYSFAFSSARYIKKLKGQYDVVFANQTSPIMMANAAVKYKKLHGTRMVLYCMDLWPESLVVGGVKRGSFLYNHYRKVSDKIYKSADKLLVTSKLFGKYFKDTFGIEEDKVEYLPQYAEDLFSAESCKKEPNETVDLLFAGNVGSAQSVETIIRAADKTQDIANLRWHIVGDGSALENCKRLAEELALTSVVFHGRKPLSEMPKYYAMTDAMLVTLLDDPVVSLTLPGKVQTYMAAGKPIIGAIGGETAEIVAKAECGYCGEAEDADALAENARRFCEAVKSGEAVKMGKNAKNFYLEHFTKEKFFEVLHANLKG